MNRLLTRQFEQDQSQADWFLFAISRETRGLSEDIFAETLTQIGDATPFSMKGDERLSGVSINKPHSFTSWVEHESISSFDINTYIVSQEPTKTEAKKTIAPGSLDFVRAQIGSDLYQKLSKKDREFLATASSLFDLGPEVNIDRILSSLKEEIR